MNHLQQQREQSNKVFAAGSRPHVLTEDVAIRYITSWRVKESLRRFIAASKGVISNDSSILILCSGEGMEGSILCDMGFSDVTVSDLSENGVQAALERDGRLKGLVLNAEKTELQNECFDVVLIQDGLHHLSSPVQRFTEMLRVARKGVIFLEPHDSLVGRMIGKKWEINGDAINYVFRWDRSLVEQIASSYLGKGRFENLSFSFWHHNVVYAKLAKMLGSIIAVPVIQATKMLLDVSLGVFGNQFCGLVLKRDAEDETLRT